MFDLSYTQTIMKCSHCNKELTPNNRYYCEKWNIRECPDCRFHRLNGTDTIEKYNAWLKKDHPLTACTCCHILQKDYEPGTTRGGSNTQTAFQQHPRGEDKFYCPRCFDFIFGE